MVVPSSLHPTPLQNTGAMFPLRWVTRTEGRWNSSSSRPGQTTGCLSILLPSCSSSGGGHQPDQVDHDDNDDTDDDDDSDDDDFVDGDDDDYVDGDDDDVTTL